MYKVKRCFAVMKMRSTTPKFEMDTPALEALTVDIDAVQRVIHELQIDPRILARVFSSGLFGYQCTLRRFHCCHHYRHSCNCTLCGSGARGMPLRPFLENTQGWKADRKIVEFPRL